MSSDDVAALPDPSAAGGSARLRVARGALEAASAVPGVLGSDPGPQGLRVTSDPSSGLLVGVSATAQPDGRYAVDLSLVADMVPLPRLAEAVRDRVSERARRDQLEDLVGSINVEFADVTTPAELAAAAAELEEARAAAELAAAAAIAGDMTAEGAAAEAAAPEAAAAETAAAEAAATPEPPPPSPIDAGGVVPPAAPRSLDPTALAARQAALATDQAALAASQAALAAQQAALAAGSREGVTSTAGEPTSGTIADGHEEPAP